MDLVYGFENGRKALQRPTIHRPHNYPASLIDGIASYFGERLQPETIVSRILKDIQEDGDRALMKYTRLLDNPELEVLEISPTALNKAISSVPRELVRSMEIISKRLAMFHQSSLPRNWMNVEEGFGEQFIPVERVGIYIPGGTAAYPSTVLMTVIPARVAGVTEIILTTPSRNNSGPDPVVLAAAKIAGIDRAFQIGGAHAIGALAYGTETIPKVDMVCGPGNIFVTLAKQMVFGHVGIEGINGPTETMIIAEEGSDPAECSADLLAQSEHDPLASPIFITTSDRLMKATLAEISRQLDQLPRKLIAGEALKNQGIAVLVQTLDEAVDLANIFAPEHLSLLVKLPWALLPRIKHAGGIFLGHYSPEAMGDYVAGPSHVMPTGGSARFNSPLGVRHFLKSTSLVALSESVFNQTSKHAARLAYAEGFDGHARAVELRDKQQKIV